MGRIPVISALWRRSRQQPQERFSLEDYAQAVNAFTYNGALYQGYGETLRSDRERIETDFGSLVRSVYKRNGIVFACMLARRAVFTEARFQFRQMRQGRPGDFFGTPDLGVLEHPWPGGVTGDLLARMLDDADLAGNFYGYRDERGEVVRLRPDWVDIALEQRMLRGGQIGWRKAGYAYFEGGQRDREPVPLRLEEVVHFAPNPDPVATYRGMSWLTPVLREITSDGQMNVHKAKFLEQGATPNMVVKLPEISPEKFAEFKKVMDAGHAGARNAYKTLYLGGGADVEVVGADFQQLDFKSVQGAGETRIAAAAGVPPVIVGLSEGLQGSSLNTGNYMAARRNFADRTIRPLWRNASSSLQTIVPPPAGAQLWVDDRDVAFLREDKKDAAEIQQMEGVTIRQLVEAGYDPDSVVSAVAGGDMRLLTHTGVFSVQLQPPQNTSTPAAEGSDDKEEA